MNQSAQTALRAVLTHATEGLDHNQDRYQQVAARFRRRRQRQGAAAAAGAVVLVAGIAVALGGGLAMAPGPDPAQPAVIDCPLPATDLPAIAPARDPLIPDGPVAARICGLLLGDDIDRYASGGEFNYTGVTLDQPRLNTLVAAVNDLAPAGGETSCKANDDTIPWYYLVFAYPDGDRVTVRVEPTGCPTVQIGDQLRAQAAQPLVELVWELADAQRLADAPASPQPPGCPDPATVTPPGADYPDTPPRYEAYVPTGGQPVPVPVSAVAVCRYSSTDPDTAELVTSTVVAGDGAGTARNLVNAQDPLAGARRWHCEPPEGSFDVLVFADAAGGRYEVRLGRGECRVFYSASRLSDEPEPALQQWVDDTLGGPPPG